MSGRNEYLHVTNVPHVRDLPLSPDMNLTVHNYVHNSTVLSRASLLSKGRTLAQTALSISTGWKNTKMVPLEPKATSSPFFLSQFGQI